MIPGSSAATHGLKPGDVLLAYNGIALNKKDDLKVIDEGEKPIGVDVWRDGRSSRRDLAPGELGVVFDLRSAPVAIAENRKLQQVLVAARSGGEDFAPLPGTRYEVEALAQVFESDDRVVRTLLGAEAGELELDDLAVSGELRQFAFIHLATHGVIDEDIPTRSAVILTQTGLPDPLEQALEPQARPRRPAQCPRNPARLGAERRAGDALGLRDRPGPRVRRRRLRWFHAGSVDVGNAERVPVALEGGRHRDGPLDATILRQPAGSPPRARLADAQGRGPA